MKVFAVGTKVVVLAVDASVVLTMVPSVENVFSVVFWQRMVWKVVTRLSSRQSRPALSILPLLAIH